MPTSDHHQGTKRETQDITAVVHRDSPRHSDHHHRRHPLAVAASANDFPHNTAADDSALSPTSSTLSHHQHSISLDSFLQSTTDQQPAITPTNGDPQQQQSTVSKNNKNNSNNATQQSATRATIIPANQQQLTTTASSSIDTNNNNTMNKQDSFQHLESPSSSSSVLSLGRSTQWSSRATVFAGTTAGLILMLHRLLTISSTSATDLFYLYYQPFAPCLFMLWLWATNVRVFERQSIRYDACFPADEQRYLLPSARIYEIAGILSTVVLSSATIFLFYCVQGNLEAAAMQPPLIYLIMLAMLILPASPFLFGDTRRFFASTAWHVITPIRRVTWADFLLADVFTSLAKAISDTERAVCAMATGDVMHPDMASCSDASWVIPAGLALPYIWRLIQCIRVHNDTGNKAQLWNALKYSTALPVIALSALKYHVTKEAWQSLWKPLWLLLALINSCYSYFWDVERDWEIGLFSQMKIQRKIVPRLVMSQQLLYKKSVYLYLLASNAFLRLSWIYKLSPHLRRNHLAVFIIVLAEAFRRFQWIFVRIEVELRKIQNSGGGGGVQLVPATPLHHSTSGVSIGEHGDAGIGGHHQQHNSRDSGGGVNGMKKGVVELPVSSLPRSTA